MKPVPRRTWLRQTGGGVLGMGLAAAGLGGGEAGPADGDDDMVAIPAGPFRMGTSREDAEELAGTHGFHVSWLSGEWPERILGLPAYAIDRTPVTNARYLEYIQAAGANWPSHWRFGRPPGEAWDHPVVGVNQADAEAYARWAGKRLPTEAEWEKAARGPDALRYPWGDAFRADACRWNPDPRQPPAGTAPVTAHPQGASPYGVMDMAGNAAEWCAGGGGGASGFLRGGGYILSDPINLRAASRIMSGWAMNRNPWYGFRCARSLES